MTKEYEAIIKFLTKGLPYKISFFTSPSSDELPAFTIEIPATKQYAGLTVMFCLEDSQIKYYYGSWKLLFDLNDPKVDKKFRNWVRQDIRNIQCD